MKGQIPVTTVERDLSYEGVLAKGIEQGIERGIEQGIERGREALLRLAALQLEADAVAELEQIPDLDALEARLHLLFAERDQRLTGRPEDR